MSTRLNIVVAHKLEAQPLLELFKLQAVSRSPASYCNKDGLRLIVSGEGSQASKAAVDHFGRDDAYSSCAAWLNVGIAGHRSLAIGDALLVNKIVRRRDGASHYPVPLGNGLPATRNGKGRGEFQGELHTVDEPEFAFPDNVAYDMEAYGFFSAAKQLTTLELVQCFKIISDNVDEDASTVTRERVLEVITMNNNRVLQLVQAMLALQQRYQEIAGDEAEMEVLAGRVHLTATQRVQLRRLLQRYRAFGLDGEIDELSRKPGLDARQLIQALHSRLQEMVS